MFFVGIPETYCINFLPQPEFLFTWNFDSHSILNIDRSFPLILNPTGLIKVTDANECFSCLHDRLVILQVDIFILFSPESVLEDTNIRVLANWFLDKIGVVIFGIQYVLHCQTDVNQLGLLWFYFIKARKNWDCFRRRHQVIQFLLQYFNVIALFKKFVNLVSYVFYDAHLFISRA